MRAAGGRRALRSRPVPARFRSLLRKILAHGLYYSGLLWLYALFKLHRRVVVLMYHRVLPEDADTYSEEGIVVTPRTFDRHLRFLKRYFQPLTLEQFVDATREGRRLPSRGCLITFDDGWHDNVTHALPLLREHGVPAVVFLATNFVGTTRSFWQERLTRKMFVAAQSEGAPRRIVEAHTVADVHSTPPLESRRIIRAAVTRMKQWTADEVANFESELDSALANAGVLPTGNGDDRFMDWEQAAGLVPPSPLVAAAHGCSHRPLTTLSPDASMAELREVRNKLQATLGQPITAIAYPNGDYDDAVVRMAREAGYLAGFTTQRGLVSEGDDPLRLRRLNVHEASTGSLPEFLCIILGVFHKWPNQV